MHQFLDYQASGDRPLVHSHTLLSFVCLVATCCSDRPNRDQTKNPVPKPKYSCCHSSKRTVILDTATPLEPPSGVFVSGSTYKSGTTCAINSSKVEKTTEFKADLNPKIDVHPEDVEGVTWFRGGVKPSELVQYWRSEWGSRNKVRVADKFAKDHALDKEESFPQVSPQFVSSILFI
ncbi:unnamed protein product [Protopolystoma xenopodis]|uniref:Uncharacterized protein n=1 Tax=Protopolystoma xenopodis TaxID=117903 RepID=A0A3S5BM84_9PLAT|nr:unnamed protein product [Protopolystoma xenopodis]